jgi:Lrp/AsnC family transcriptional regulator, leucine-responsive regulatory protein
MNDRRLDPTDERILRLLVRNARATWREVGDVVGLSANAVAQRVRRLEQAGVVRGWTAVLDPALDGPGNTALVSLKVTTDADVAELEAGIAALACVTEVLDLSGTVDYQVRVVFRDSRDLYDATNALRVLPGVVGIETRTVLREVLRRDGPGGR